MLVVAVVALKLLEMVMLQVAVMVLLDKVAHKTKLALMVLQIEVMAVVLALVTILVVMAVQV
jgi:hypothetical protein